ncbi:hypothetical protein K2173_008215 [Erythroxylum novogranatense]|uniref:Uncharacterized protein n=1 Tax=Erythroxylum novogranatense TaxID=1862640 RepID=A0AAV8S7A3_9ROSI|nr:hypothetical protein K2173_008215 [Erythroxylum novogranatense]
MANGRWNSKLITAIFNNCDSGLILSLPLSGNGVDGLLWLYEDKGFFSVKSAYKTLTCGNQEPRNAEIAQSIDGKSVELTGYLFVHKAGMAVFLYGMVFANGDKLSRVAVEAQVVVEHDRTTDGVITWRSPDFGWVKLNIDVATTMDDSYTGSQLDYEVVFQHVRCFANEVTNGLA